MSEALTRTWRYACETACPRHIISARKQTRTGIDELTVEQRRPQRNLTTTDQAKQVVPLVEQSFSIEEGEPPVGRMVDQRGERAERPLHFRHLHPVRPEPVVDIRPQRRRLFRRQRRLILQQHTEQDLQPEQLTLVSPPEWTVLRIRSYAEVLADGPVEPLEVPKHVAVAEVYQAHSGRGERVGMEGGVVRVDEDLRV